MGARMIGANDVSLFIQSLIGLGVLLGAMAGTWGLVALLIRLAPRIGLVDRPNERSLHTRVTPRGGGIGFVMTAVIAWVGWLVWTGGVGNGGAGVTWCAAALVLAGVSLWDDFRSLGAGLRLLVHLTTAAAAVVALGAFHAVDTPWLTGFELVGGLGVAATVVWVVGLTNVYNFMDGIDGIAGAQGVVTGLGWALAGIVVGSPATAFMGWVVAGGCAGFLLHNWSPAKIFMGDVGSAFLGYTFAVLPLLALSDMTAGRTHPLIGVGRLPLFAVLVVWPFIADGFLTFSRRLLKGEKVWKPHRTHLYQRLVQAGASHRQVAAGYGVWALVSAASGLGWLEAGAKGGEAGSLVQAGVAVALAGLPVMWVVTKWAERRVGRG